MRCRIGFRAWLQALTLAWATSSPVAFPSPAHASPLDSLAEKLGDLQLRYEKGSKDPKDFEIGEEEVNLFLRNESLGPLPEGIESPWIRFEDSLAVVGAMVDIDKFRANLPDSMLFQLLSGRVPVEITARLTGEKGVGKLDLQRVVLSGVELPASLVALLAQAESAKQFLPTGFRIGEPFDLPFDLDSIQCRVGAVLMRQRPTVLTK
jgi:hypothetical protein